MCNTQLFSETMQFVDEEYDVTVKTVVCCVAINSSHVLESRQGICCSHDTFLSADFSRSQ